MIFYNLSVTSGKLCNDPEIIKQWLSRDLAGISRMGGGGEVTETPYISQGRSAVTVRSKQDAWGDLLIAAGSGNCCNLWNNFNYSLKSWGQQRDRPKMKLLSLSHRVVTAVTEQSLHDFAENEATMRQPGTRNCYVTMALITFKSSFGPAHRSGIDCLLSCAVKPLCTLLGRNKLA